jgi:hypothetical protein
VRKIIVLVLLSLVFGTNLVDSQLYQDVLVEGTLEVNTDTYLHGRINDGSTFGSADQLLMVDGTGQVDWAFRTVEATSGLFGGGSARHVTMGARLSNTVTLGAYGSLEVRAGSLQGYHLAPNIVITTTGSVSATGYSAGQGFFGVIKQAMIAGGTITLGDCLKMSGADWTVIRTTSKNDTPIGIAANNATTGQQVEVIILGVVLANSGGATINAGAECVPNNVTDGCVEAGANPGKIVGTSMTAASGGTVTLHVHLR